MEVDKAEEVVPTNVETTVGKGIHKRVSALSGRRASSSLEIPSSPFLHMLGYGSGMGVFTLERSPKVSGGTPRSPWAIKKLKSLRTPSKKLFSERLEYEADILKVLNHPNIIGYRGLLRKEGQPVLAMEKAPHSLGEMIVERVEKAEVTFGDGSDSFEEGRLNVVDPFPAKSIEKVAVDVAKALEYLHKEAKLIHGDVKSANVLIFGDFDVAKLCDFGVARKIKGDDHDGTIEGEYAGTQMWTPMEVVMKNNGNEKWPVTEKADIYAYGLTLFEMMSLQPPHLPTLEDSLLNTDTAGSDADDSFFDNILQENLGKRPVLPDIEFDDSYNLILALFYCCSEEDPTLRPRATDIVKLLLSNDNTPKPKDV